ncbi:hypothetical protein L0337_06930 [candidate division KSB1 bacterium]|nr:hypothetical protein [candidate division KSB1 bacterium]
MRLKSLFVILLLNCQLFAQNLDLLTHHASGKYRGMAGAGMAAVQGVSSVDFNPAGLAGTQHISFSTSQSTTYYRYALFRQNVDKWAFNLDWHSSQYNFENILAVIPLNKKIGLGIGYIQKLNPFLKNSRRAITGSSLINQVTDGSVYALTVASGVTISKNILLGISLARYTGTVTSKLQGDNHGRELFKSAQLESDLKGMNFDLGIIFKSEKFSAGVAFAPPFELTVDTQKQISEDNSYASLFPNYDQTKWKMPWIGRLGFAYTGYQNWTFAFDLETHHYESSEVRLNLVEFGGAPNWKDSNILRAGIEFYPFRRPHLPVRLGYAYIPQLYASNQAIGEGNTILSYENTKQNIRHLFAAGTKLSYSNFILNLGLEYALLKWHRDLQTLDSIVDDYKEKNYVLAAELICSFQQ